ncbi:acetyl-CoA C-acyltransferase [bacterium DOLJORAL78_65_58]|nr:MAG: acetyl-CoA C-acyltransferase [bacterium DOLZORAL124_64_63]PIE75752.1 MAG: acetyl-CoA C-acyltransferase [bacterium DOLJORAL78_65_58]
MREVVVAAARRTAVGKALKGTLRHTRPDDLGAAVVKNLLETHPNLDPALVGDVIMGCAMPEGEQGMNVGRNIALLAGLPVTVPGMTVNRFCSSGLEAINLAAMQIATGMHDAAIAGGVESMTMIPMGGLRYLPNPTLAHDTPQTLTNMGLTAENLVARDQITREDQDAFAYHSHMKAVAAIQEGRFEDEIVPVKALLPAKTKSGRAGSREVQHKVDEGPRPDTTIEGLSKLRPAFKQGGTVTAGNSSQMSDGAAAVLLMTPELATRIGARPLARFVGYAVAGVEPEIMGIGPVRAVPKVLERTGLSLEQMDIIELNEAFAAQSLAVLKHLNLDARDERLNVNGGAVALGHPLGCTGAKLTATALHELKRRGGRYALVTMCIGTGMGAAGIFERL